jgi:hypothetical protein
MRVLFFLRAINYDRVFEGALRATLERGHEIHVALEVDKRVLPVGAGKIFDALGADFPGFSYEILPRRRDAWLAPGTELRYALDYLRYVRPEYADAPALTARARERAPRPLRLLIDRAARRGPEALDRLDARLRRLEAATPLPAELLAYLRERDPDLVMVAPLVGLGFAQSDVIRAADRLGLPSALLVASWDNLTNKGVIRHAPTTTIVWNEGQVREAVELHRVPRERVVHTGAHAFDHWFTWTPSTSAEEFAAKVGLDPGRRYLLYVCSSNFIAGKEAEFIGEWLGHLRASEHEELREAGVLIRPHPQNVAFWADAAREIAEPGRAVVWPVGGAAPASAEAKADYFDSLHHCSAVVGINTSALIEAAIVRRPVFTILDPRFAGTQGGTLHFAHLTGSDGQGLLTVAEDWPQHLDDLAGALQDPERHEQRLQRFLESFIRPHGMDEPAAPRVVDALEATAAQEPAPSTPSGRLPSALETLTPVVAAIYFVRDLRRRLIAIAVERTSDDLRRRVREVVPFLAAPPAPKQSAVDRPAVAADAGTPAVEAEREPAATAAAAVPPDRGL